MNKGMQDTPGDARGSWGSRFVALRYMKRRTAQLHASGESRSTGAPNFVAIAWTNAAARVTALVAFARGGASPGDRWTAAGDMAAIAFDAMLETGVLIDPLPLWASELLQPELFNNSALIENIRRDGLRL